MRLVIQHSWIATGKARRSCYRLVIYGDRQIHRDFDSLEQLDQALRIAGISVDTRLAEQPDPRASSILLSHSLDVEDTQLSALERIH